MARYDQRTIETYLGLHSSKVKSATLDVALAYWLMGQSIGQITSLYGLTRNAVRLSIRRMRRRVKAASRKHLRD